MILAAAAHAQEDPSDGSEPPITFEPLVVTATRLPAPLSQVPASVSVVEGIDVQGAQRSVGLEESLDRVPGVLVQSSENFAQDARIQIRGFGTRAAFGIREIRVPYVADRTTRHGPWRSTQERVRSRPRACCGRRMAVLAAHLIDGVLGVLPVRQWVLTLPHRLALRAGSAIGSRRWKKPADAWTRCGSRCA